VTGTTPRIGAVTGIRFRGGAWIGFPWGDAQTLWCFSRAASSGSRFASKRSGEPGHAGSPRRCPVHPAGLRRTSLSAEKSRRGLSRPGFLLRPGVNAASRAAVTGGDPHGRVPVGRRSLEAGAVSELQGIARYKFHEGKLEEFKRLSARCMEILISGREFLDRDVETLSSAPSPVVKRPAGSR
jgi:hypothetical protein